MGQRIWWRKDMLERNFECNYGDNTDCYVLNLYLRPSDGSQVQANVQVVQKTAEQRIHRKPSHFKIESESYNEQKTRTSTIYPL
jgi:hypothetical protein